MSLEAPNTSSWLHRRVGEVPLGSPRGITAALLMLAAVVGAFYGAVVQLVEAAMGHPPAESPVLSRELLGLNLLFNAFVLLLLPVFSLAIARPQHAGAVAERLRMVVTSRTPLHVLVGVAATAATMLVLAGILYGLDQAGVYHAEESALVPQIQALLDWPLVIAIPVVAAVTEEVFFRGVLQPRVGLIASSLLFGVVHLGYGTLLQFVAPALLGLLFGFLFLRTKSLWAPIAAHFTFDFIELALLYTEKSGAP